jgi:hypothetical protein
MIYNLVEKGYWCDPHPLYIFEQYKTIKIALAVV